MTKNDQKTTLLPEEELTKKAYDDMAHQWSGSHPVQGFWKREMQRLQQFLPGGTVLEIGSGGGQDAIELINMGYDYVGTDISPALLKLARKKSPQAEFFEQSVYDLSFPGTEPFDGFWAAAVLLHVPKHRMDEALQSIARVVKKDAIGFITMKDGKGEGLKSHSMSGKEMQRFISYWDATEFGDILRKNNYEVLEFASIPVVDRPSLWHCYFVKANSN